MTQGSAKLLSAPNDAGYFVVKLDKIEPKDASKGNDELVAGTQQGLGSVIGDELADQFSRAVRGKVGVKQNPQAIATIRQELGGGAGAAN